MVKSSSGLASAGNKENMTNKVDITKVETKVEKLSPSEKEALVAPLIAELKKSREKDAVLDKLTEVCKGCDCAMLAIWKADGTGELVQLARSGTTSQVAVAANLLAALAHFADGRYAIKDEGGLPPLIALARDVREEEPHKLARCAAQHALKFLALAYPVKQAILGLGYGQGDEQSLLTL